MKAENLLADLNAQEQREAKELKESVLLYRRRYHDGGLFYLNGQPRGVVNAAIVLLAQAGTEVTLSILRKNCRHLIIPPRRHRTAKYPPDHA